MEEKPKSKLQEALKNKLNQKKNNFNNKVKTNNKLDQNFKKSNKIHIDNVGKRPQNRGD